MKAFKLIHRHLYALSKNIRCKVILTFWRKAGEFFTSTWNWWRHMIWLVKQMIKHLWNADWIGLHEAYMLAKIHITYKSKKVK